MSDIVQLDGCGSLSTLSTPDNVSTFSHFSSTIDNQNSSFLSQASVLSEEPVSLRDQQIPVVTGVTNHRLDISAPAWHEWHQPRPAGLPAVRQTVRRDNRLLAAAQLPSFSAPNCRSLGPRLRNFAEDMLTREVTVALCSETWEKTTSKKYQKEVERFLEMKGLWMVSNPRKYRRGGGVCIVADLSKNTLQPIDKPNPYILEIDFALMKPIVLETTKSTLPQNIVIFKSGHIGHINFLKIGGLNKFGKTCNMSNLLVPVTMSLLYVRSKVCMAPFHVRSKVCIAPIHVRSKV